MYFFITNLFGMVAQPSRIMLTAKITFLIFASVHTHINYRKADLKLTKSGDGASLRFFLAKVGSGSLSCRVTIGHGSE
jgi:hypothetical protein